MQHANEENPYFAARAEWNERYGNEIQAAYTWKRLAFVSQAIAVCAVVGCIFLATRAKYIPYVIQVDPKGQVLQAVIPAAAQANDRVIETDLGDFIIHLRSVVTDAQVQGEYLARAYAHVTPESAPKTAMDAFFSGGGNPYQRVAKETVTVEVESVLGQSKNSYQVEWRENTSALQGQPLSTQRYRALIGVEYREIEQAMLSKNPLGLFITSLSIQKIGG
jgi:type IV secretion system protein VirB5